MKRQQIVAGNWKMNKNIGEGKSLTQAIADQKSSSSPVVLILGTPYIHLQPVGEIIAGAENLYLSAQNCHHEESGAYTGEISAAMLKSVGAEYVILGHSERREYFGEDEALLTKKVDIALAHGLIPIFCCGEKLDVREAGNHVELVQKQLAGSVFHLPAEDFRKLVIAYEPVWAIGTGKTASPEQAQDMHAAIRKMISDQYGAGVADATSILYGGSCKPANAKEIFSQPDVDGGLIGGASLKADDFIAIANSF